MYEGLTQGRDPLEPSDLHAADTTDVPRDEEDAMGIESPEADTVEQHTPLKSENDDRLGSVPFDVDEADAAEQSRVVELDEDDYR